jgi:hypothetical protein
MSREMAANIERQVAEEVADSVEQEVADSVSEQVAEEVADSVERTLGEGADPDAVASTPTEAAGRGSAPKGEESESNPGGAG